MCKVAYGERGLRKIWTIQYNSHNQIGNTVIDYVTNYVGNIVID